LVSVSVSPDTVRNLVNLTADDVADAKVTEFLTQAAGEISLETSLTIDYSDCTEAEAAAVRLLGALYCLCYVTGGSAAGRSFSLGDLRVDVQNQVPPLSVLQSRLERLIEKLTEPYVGMV
jgi:hypothetical protein